jgi:hypothetical protein
MIRQTKTVPTQPVTLEMVYQLLTRMQQNLADTRVRLERIERNLASDRDYAVILSKQTAPHDAEVESAK